MSNIIASRRLSRVVPRPSPTLRLAGWYSRRPLSIPAQDVRILEVGPRDGLQNIKENVPTSVKLELIRRLLDTGLTNIETTSFTSPKWIPQLSDSREVLSATKEMVGERNISLPALVPNMKGLTQALATKAHDIVVFVSASEGFSQKNTNCSVEEGLARAAEVTKAALAQGLRVRGVVSCIISCPYDGPTNPAKVLGVVTKLLDMGCYEVGLGDTVGVGTPADVDRLLRVILSEVPAGKLAGHFHDTYGQAIANVVKAYDMGLRAFDSSVAGLGGCPYAKGAKGNLATEDVIYTFERTGVRTGVDLDKLADTGDWISRTIKVPNNSRAGAAIMAKAAAASMQTTKPDAIKSPPVIKWETVKDEGEYRVSRSANAVKITLTRPKNGNALTTSMVDGITALFRSLARDPTTFHIVLEAEGSYFCTGMDLSSGGSSASNDADEKAKYYKKVRELFTTIEEAPQTTIAAVNGPCFGGGVGLAFAFDIRLLSEKAKFTMTEVKLGLIPAIISRFLVREWGASFLREAMLTGREVSGQELQRIGTVHCINENVEEAIEAYLAKLSQCAPGSAVKCKELIQLAYADPAGPVLEDKIRQTFADMMEPGSEGEFGLAQFRKKIRGVDWASFWARKSGADGMV